MEEQCYYDNYAYWYDGGYFDDDDKACEVCGGASCDCNLPRCIDCGEAMADYCHCCSGALCAQCFETGVGFCNKCPTLPDFAERMADVYEAMDCIAEYGI